jgi:DNA polymerase III delta prime subunit
MSELFFESVGGKNARQLFSQMTPQALGHGYLFTGPTGIGKKTFARRLAQSLLCASTQPLVGYCKTCASCRMFASNTHPDYTESLGEIKIGKNGEKSGDDLTARGLVRQLALHAYHGTHRIVVLGDVAFATDESANALLKFFEEPPAGVLIMLTTSVPGGIISTIQSRLVEVSFERLAADEIATILEAEGIAPAVARNAAAGSMGSITQARALLVDSTLSLRSIAFAWTAAAMTGKSPELDLNAHGATPSDRRAWMEEFLNAVRIITRDYAVAIVAGGRAPKLAGELATQIASLPKRSAREATALLEAVHDTIRISQTNVSAALVADYLKVALAPASATTR